MKEEEEAEVQQSDNHTTTNTKKHQKSSEKEHSHETANKFHDRSSKNHIPDIFPPHPPKPPLLKHKSALSTPLIIAIVATLVFAALFILFLIVKKIRSKKHKDAILDMAKPHGPNTYVSMDGSKISANNLSAPNANPWIMSQDEVTVFFDQKLGSGVGENVFKGKINGKAAVLNVFPKLVAINKFRDCDVAVKILPAFADSNAKLQFDKEIYFMKSLHYHPHLISMLGHTDQMLLLEYCSQGDLLHLVRSRSLEIVNGLEEDNGLKIKDLVSFSWQISSGLEYLHSKSLIHRDVAARNVLLDEANICKIGDFGMCRLAENLMYTMDGGGRLPIRWLSIETLKTYEYSSKSDVWSFAVLLFELFSLGELPYVNLSNSQLLGFLEEGKRLAKPTHCTQEVYEIMVECWNLDVENRPNFTEIREKLAKLLEKSSAYYGYVVPINRSI